MAELTPEQYRELLEKKLASCSDKLDVPINLNPDGPDGLAWREGRRSVLQWALEMLPRHS